MRRGLITILAVAALGVGMIVLLLGGESGRGRGVLQAAAPVREVDGAHADAARPLEGSGAPGHAVQRDAVAVPSLPEGPTLAEFAAEPPPEDGLEIVVRWRADRRPAPGARVTFLEWETLERAASMEHSNARRWEAAERFGRTFAADAAGVARVPQPHGTVLVCARAAGGYGRLNLDPLGTGRQVLELEPDRTLRVRVHDAAGAPLGGRAVALRGRGYGDILVAWTRPEDGIAELAHVQASAAELRGKQLFVALALLGRTPVQRAIDLAALPEEIDLEAPTGGALRLLLETADGKPVNEPVSYTLTRSRTHLDRDLPAGSINVTAPQGEIVLAGVELGLELRVRAYSPAFGVTSKIAPGPQVPDELVELRLATTAAALKLAGRAVLEDGTPLAGADLRLHIEVERDGNLIPSSGTRLKADAEGRFVYPLQRSRPQAGSRTSLVVSVGDDGALREGSVAVDLAALPELADLGDVVLLEASLLAAGRVVDPLGQGIAGAVVALSVPQDDDAQRMDRFRDVSQREHRARTDRTGAFEVRGRSSAPALVASAWHADYASPEPAPVLRGATALTLTLTASGTIAGHLLLDDEIPFTAVTLIALDGRGEIAAANTSIASDGRFTLAGLRAGTYSIAARLRAESMDIGRADGIVAEPLRTNEDPALEPLDLRGRIRHFQLDVLDPDGKRLRWFRFRRRVSGEGGSYVEDAAGHESLVLYTGGRALDLRLSAEGYRTIELLGVDSDRSVTLEAGISLTLVFGPELQAFDREHPVYVALHHGQEDTDYVEVDGDRASTRLGAFGRLSLSFLVERKDEFLEFGAGLGLAIDVADVSEPQTFEVTLSPAALQEVRALLQR